MNLRWVRDDFPAVAQVGYLNTGTLGPMPWPVVRKFQQMVEDYHRQGPALPGAGEMIRVKAAECRERLASLLGAKREEIALMESTSAGINAALLSIAWEPGDEVIITDIEHAAVSIAVHHLQSRYWAKPVVVASRHGNVTAAQIEEAVTRRTKAVCLSHVSYCTGGRLPIEEIARVVEAHRLLLVVDGAQSAGAVDVNLDELGCHFYAFPGYKWLLGPEGTAGLFVRADVAKVSLVSQAGFRGVNFTGPGGDYEPAGGARRFELSTMSGLNFAALSGSLDYLESAGAGRGHIGNHDAALASTFKRLLAGTPGVTLLTPKAAGESGALVAFTVAGVEGADALDQAVRWLLNTRRFLIRAVRQTGVLRASFHLYNTFDEAEALATAVRELAAAAAR